MRKAMVWHESEEEDVIRNLGNLKGHDQAAEPGELGRDVGLRKSLLQRLSKAPTRAPLRDEAGRLQAQAHEFHDIRVPQCGQNANLVMPHAYARRPSADKR